MSDLDRHLANRAELLAAEDAVKARWADEDRTREASRAAHMEAFQRGRADVDAVIVAAGGEVPTGDVVEPVPEPVKPATETESF